MSRARRAKADHGIKMICVDYLQLMQSNKRIENRNQEVGEIVRHVKSIARELDVPIVALCQLEPRGRITAAKTASTIGPAGVRLNRGRS